MQKKYQKLSKRLQAIADNIDKTNTIADIGSDHAYLAIYLSAKKRAAKIIGSDLNKGPLDIAKNNIKKYSAKNIELRLGAGFHPYEINEVNTYILAGMGGILISKIIEENLEIAHSATKLILQAQSDLTLLRKFLHQNDFKIDKEIILKEDNIFYKIIIISTGDELYQSESDYVFGKYLIDNKSETLKDYLENEFKKMIKIKSKLLKENESKAVNSKLIDISKLINMIDEVMIRYEH